MQEGSRTYKCRGRRVSRKKWTLIVDDNRVNIRFQQILFEHVGFSCDAAVDGATAKLKLGEKKYDLLVTDLLLGDCYGWELIEYARGMDPEIRTVGWTAARMVEFAGYFHVVCENFTCDLDKRLVDVMLPKPSFISHIQSLAAMFFPDMKISKFG